MIRGCGVPARGGRCGRLVVALALLCAVALGALASPGGAAAAPVTLTFAYTGAAQSWVVPVGVTSATFAVYGAQGGAFEGYDRPGGKGGSATATLAVTPGATVAIYVGGHGASVLGGGAGGFNGGGDASPSSALIGGAGGGGGASDVRIGGGDLAHRALIAGGGGGAGNGFSADCGGGVVGGAGGGLVGGDGISLQCFPASGGNQAGTYAGGNPGQLGQGGAGDAGTGGSGGGGGGYYGGAGGGNIAGGGGGSGFGPGGTVFATGVREGDGLVTVAFEAIPATAVAARGAATYGDATATLTAAVTSGGSPIPAGGQVRFTFRGTVVGTVPTNAQGVAALTVPLPAGTAAGTYARQVVAEYLGADGYLPSAATGPLVVARRILTVKPADQTVVLRQPNPTGCALALAPGSAFLPGDSWASVNLTNLRCTTSRNYPSSNAAETVGKTYKLSATGFSSANYDLRLQQGTLTVVAP